MPCSQGWGNRAILLTAPQLRPSPGVTASSLNHLNSSDHILTQKFWPWGIKSCQSNTALKEGKKLSFGLISKVSFPTVPADHKQTDKNKRTIRHPWFLLHLNRAWSLFRNLETFVFHVFPTQLLSLYSKTAKREKDCASGTQLDWFNSHSEEY